MEIGSLDFSTSLNFSNIERIKGLDEIQNGMFNNSNNGGFEVVNADFRDVFAETLNNVRETDAELAHEQYKFVTGQSEDTHSLGIAATKAQVSLELLTTLRDKTLEAYNELIKTSL